VVELIKKKLSADPFDILVTHVPHDPGSPSYGTSLCALQDIKLLIDMPIIAYTGATGMIQCSISGIADRIVDKSDYIRKDLERIEYLIEYLVKKYRTPRNPEPPVIFSKDGFTMVKVRINLIGGMLSGIVGVAEECQKHHGAALMQQVDKGEDSPWRNAKKPIELLLLGALEEQEVLIKVQGEDAEAERVIRRIYGVLTSRYSFDLKPNRFEI
jgi:phosphotransferase system HPr-like phosphotransfer protein